MRKNKLGYLGFADYLEKAKKYIIIKVMIP